MSIKKVLITGVSKGIGLAMAQELVKNNNYYVYGTTRNLDNIKDKIQNVEYVELDFTDDSSIENLVKKVEDIDILINNAGIVHISAVEETTIEKYKEIFDVNFYGVLKLIKRYVKKMKEKRNGIIINIGSLADKFALPYMSGYVATKSALAGYTWSLRMELKEFGIKVIMISPTDINTTMTPEIFYDEGSLYKSKLLDMASLERRNMDKAPGPEVVAKLLMKILGKSTPKPFYTVGYMSKLLLFLKKFLNDQIIEKIIIGQLNQTNKKDFHYKMSKRD